MSDDTENLDVNGKLAVVKRDIEHQSKTLDRIEAAIAAGKTDSDKRFEALTATVKGWIDHESGNRRSAVQALEAKVTKDMEELDGRLTAALSENQKQSDDRFTEAKDKLFAGKWVEKPLLAIGSSFGLAIVAAIIKLVILH